MIFGMILKVLGLVGMLSDELDKAAEDGKITVGEGLDIIREVCKSIGIDFDEEGWIVTPPVE